MRLLSLVLLQSFVLSFWLLRAQLLALQLWEAAGAGRRGLCSPRHPWVENVPESSNPAQMGKAEPAGSWRRPLLQNRSSLPSFNAQGAIPARFAPESSMLGPSGVWGRTRPMGSWGALGGVWPAGRGRFSSPSTLPW